MHYLDESHILLFLVQLFIIIGFARGLGELFKKFKQPALTAEILVGVILGPTVLGRFLPALQQTIFPVEAIQQTMLDTVAWVGVLFLLLETGLEIDFSIAWRQRGSAFLIAISDIVVPMIIAFAAVVFLPSKYMVNPDQRIVFSLFMATVMTISAMPVAARVLHDLKLLKADMGFLVMSALAVNDIIGWVLFTIIMGIFTASTVEMGSLLFVFLSTVSFAVLALTFGRYLSTRVFDSISLRNFSEPGTSLTIIVLLGLLFGSITQKLGIHALFGFFIAGVVAGEARSLSEKTRSIISQMVHSLFVPLFFVNIGLKIDFITGFDIPLVVLMCVVGIIGRYFGAWFGVTLTNVPRVNRDLISIAHTPGGMMEIVVALLALETGLITTAVFVAIVFSAVFSSALMGPWMTWSLARRKKVLPSTFLLEDAVIAELKGQDRNDAIRQLADKIEKERNDVRESIIEEAVMREAQLGTAIGSGVAVPHVRVDGLKNPVIAFGRSFKGIEWNAPDGEAVHSVFLLAMPAGTEDIHVQTLGFIASAMSVSDNRKKIMNASDSMEIYEILKVLLAGEKKSENQS